MYYIVETDKSFEQASTDLEAAVSQLGFGVLHIHDLLCHLEVVDDADIPRFAELWCIRELYTALEWWLLRGGRIARSGWNATTACTGSSRFSMLVPSLRSPAI